MSQSVRQSNLFAAEDFTKIYKSFQDVDFTAYDFDTIKAAMVEYIQVHYPEDFNDYIESSEFIAIIELLAYLGTSLAFRVDLNSRENVMDTAQRRESIIRLARLINYTPKRNIAANGLFKVSSVLTDQPLTDSVGNSIANVKITWGDANNSDWFDQFLTILNNALNPTNPFGKPTKSGTVGSIPTDLYEMNNVLGLNVTMPLTLQVNGESIPIDIVNPDFEDGMTFSEKHPDPNEPFSFIYRNDSMGVRSNETGFFLHFRQGTLQNQDEVYDFPEPNRVQDISNTGINNSDVFFQEIDDTGAVRTKWQKVPAVSGTNVIYNSIGFDDRDIFEVISGLDDTVSVKFPDGNFGNIPTGIYRYWYRTSIGRNIVIRPEDAKQLTSTIPYVGTDGQTYRMLVTFGLKQTVSNSSPTETNEQIKLRAPQTYYSQERMVNREDYNVFPLTYGNEIAKLRSVNRTHAGHSRYIDINDPTGFNNNISVLGNDGAIYRDYATQKGDVTITDTTVGDIVFDALQAFVSDNDELDVFFKQEYLTSFRNAFGNDYFDLPVDTTWKTSPDRYKNDTGYFEGSPGAPVNTSDDDYRFIVPGAVGTFEDETSTVAATFYSVTNNGIPTEQDTIGPIELSTDISKDWSLTSVIPEFRRVFNAAERSVIEAFLANQGPFLIGYDVSSDTWYIVESTTSLSDTFDIAYNDNDGKVEQNATSALIQVSYEDGTYTFESRGTVISFTSLNQVQFYYDSTSVSYDQATGKSLNDTIRILPSSDITAPDVTYWNISGMFTDSDGYQDPSKVQIMPVDGNKDGTVDTSGSFTMAVGDNDEVVFERYTDVNGYIRTRPWTASFNEDMVDADSVTAVILDTDSNAVSEYNQGFRVGDGPFVPLADADLFVFKNSEVIDGIVDDITTALRATDANLRNNANKFVDAANSKSLRAGPIGTDISSRSNYKTLSIDTTTTPGAPYAVASNDNNHFGKNGISYEQNTNASDTTPMLFKWDHYAPTDQRIDPSISNIIDMIILTDTYYKDVLIWKDNKGTLLTMPKAPTTEELRISFSELSKYKSISDQIVFNSGAFKLLFGKQADDSLRATFKAVKISTASMSDNELKTRIVQAIDQYFDIYNWDFGEKFYFTELAAYIHTKLSKYLSSVVIVPTKAESEFGHLFEIVSNPNELFLSTATVDNVEIVSNYTETNLRL